MIVMVKVRVNSEEKLRLMEVPTLGKVNRQIKRFFKNYRANDGSLVFQISFQDRDALTAFLYLIQAGVRSEIERAREKVETTLSHDEINFALHWIRLREDEERDHSQAE